MGTALSGHEKPTEGLKAARTAASADDTTALDPTPIRDAEIAELQARYGVTAWFGFHTRHWWALDEDRLVEGATPDRLVSAVMAARRRAW